MCEHVGMWPRVLPEPVRLAFAPLGPGAPWEADFAALSPEEAEPVARAVQKRRAEFAVGRRLARTLLAELGAVPGPLLAGPDRRPRWPAGVLGSISHSDALCAVAAVRRGEGLASIGLDVERLRPLGADVLAAIARPEERARLERLPPAWRDVGGLLLFAAKEAVYKAQSPLTDVFLEFEAVSIELDLGAQGTEGAFQATLTDQGGAPAACSAGLPARLEGRLALAFDHALCGCAVPGG